MKGGIAPTLSRRSWYKPANSFAVFEMGIKLTHCVVGLRGDVRPSPTSYGALTSCFFFVVLPSSSPPLSCLVLSVCVGPGPPLGVGVGSGS